MSKVHRLVERRTIKYVIFNRKWGIITYGEFIKEWGSVIEAAKALRIDSSAIAKCCRHVPKYKRAGGYVWEYKENYGD